MATLKTIWLLPVFVLGICVGAVTFSHTRSAVRELTPTIDLSQPIVIYACDNTFKMTLTPCAYQVEGKSICINKGMRDEIYYVDFSNKLLVSCTRLKE